MENDPVDTDVSPPMASDPPPVGEVGPEVHPGALDELREHLAKLEHLLDPQR